jgi:hypothetical protein
MANGEWRMEKDGEWRAASGKEQRMANSEWRMVKDGESGMANVGRSVGAGLCPLLFAFVARFS